MGVKDHDSNGKYLHQAVLGPVLRAPPTPSDPRRRVLSFIDEETEGYRGQVECGGEAEEGTVWSPSHQPFRPSQGPAGGDTCRVALSWRVVCKLGRCKEQSWPGSGMAGRDGREVLCLGRLLVCPKGWPSGIWLSHGIL